MNALKTVTVVILIGYVVSIVIVPGVLFAIGVEEVASVLLVVGAITFVIGFKLLDAASPGSKKDDSFFAGLIFYTLCVLVFYYPTRLLVFLLTEHPVQSTLITIAVIGCVSWFVYGRYRRRVAQEEAQRLAELRQQAYERTQAEKAVRTKERRRREAEEAARIRERVEAERHRELRKRRAALNARRKEQAKQREEAERRRTEAMIQKIGASAGEVGQIEAMSGSEFEVFMEKFLRVQGYDVRRLGGAGDQGVDLLLKQDGRTVAVQLKRYARPLGNKPIQEVFAGRLHYKADEAWVITTSSFTKGGVDLARSTNVKLIDGRELSAWLQEAGAELAEG